MTTRRLRMRSARSKALRRLFLVWRDAAGLAWTRRVRVYEGPDGIDWRVTSKIRSMAGISTCRTARRRRRLSARFEAGASAKELLDERDRA